MKNFTKYVILSFFLLFVGCGGEIVNKTNDDNNGQVDNEINDDSAVDENEVLDESQDDANDTSETLDDSPVDNSTTTDEVTEVPDEDSGSPIDPETVPEHCRPLQTGMNTLMINGEARGFYLDIPKAINSGTNWPVVFAWHGLGDSAANFRGLISHYIDGGYSYIAVTPVSRAQQPPGGGVEWNNLKGAEGNDEVMLYDAILFCLEAKYGTDEERIHSAGFSAGSIMSDLLGTLRGDKIASIFTYSGAYFSNQANVSDLGLLASFISWSNPIPSQYTQVLVHGNEIDDKYEFGMGMGINFNHTATNDHPWLSGNGHNVIKCDHGQGHTNAGPNSLAMIEFFKNHPRNTPSPWESELPSTFDGCSFTKGQ